MLAAFFHRTTHWTLPRNTVMFEQRVPQKDRWIQGSWKMGAEGSKSCTRVTIVVTSYVCVPMHVGDPRTDNVLAKAEIWDGWWGILRDRPKWLESILTQGTSQLRSKTWHRVVMDAGYEGRAAKMDASSAKSGHG
eukprot:Skav210613  [mRNA]  locus=scaffold234:283811:284215:+ [translate_table: standard]